MLTLLTAAPEESYVLLRVLLQPLGGIVAALLAILGAYHLIEDRKERAAERERMRQVAAEFVAAAQELAAANLSHDATESTHRLKIKMMVDAKNIDPMAVPNAKAELAILSKSASEAHRRFMVTNAKMLMMLRTAGEVSAFDAFAKIILAANPPLDTKPPADSLNKYIYTNDYVRSWALKQALSLSRRRPQFDFDMSGWQPDKWIEKTFPEHEVGIGLSISGTGA